MECEILCTIGFDLGFPLSCRFFRWYSYVLKLKIRAITLGCYILETALMEYSLCINTSESKLAAAAMVLSMKMMDVKSYKATLEQYSGYKIEELSSLVTDLVKMLKRPTPAIKNKYSHRVFYEVAKLPVPDANVVITIMDH